MTVCGPSAPYVWHPYTAVLVASSITKDEAKINGNSIHVVLVGTSADYGTGTVVYMIC